MSRALTIPAVMLAVIAVGCTPAIQRAASEPPIVTLAQRIAEHDLDEDSMLRLDEETLVAVRPSGISPELIILVRDARGSWQVGSGSGDNQTVDDGRVAMVSFGGTTNQNWNQFVFGIGPDEVADVRLVGLEGRAAIVDPETDAWVIALPTEVSLDRLRWQLIGPNAEVLFDALGLAPANQ